MYCLEKLQRELAYYFSKDIRELPKVESLLAEAGYTQIRKGNDIIEIDSALGRYSADLGDSSVETKELHTKTTSKLTKDELDNLPIATAQEYGEFLEKIAQKDYQNTPEILKIATLNNDLQELINNNHSASVFITRARAGHISEVRKGEYDQALTLEEQKQIPAEIAQAKQAYTDDKSGFILPFADKNNSEKINLIILDSDSKGNFLITAKKVNSAELNNPKYKKLARAGVEPATTTPPKAEQKPTEAISLARDEIIPQSTQEKLAPLINKDAIKFNPSGKDLMEQSPKSKDIDTANFNAPSENPNDTIPQKSLMNYALLDNNLVEAIGQKIFRNYNKPYKERMSEIREFFTLPKEHFTKILDKYKREVNSLEKGEIYNKIATTMSIDEITDEITRSLKIKRERGYAAQAEKYFNELEEKAFYISKMLQDMPYQIRDFVQNSAIDYKAAQWQKLLNTLDRLIARNNERILENVQIRHKEYVEKFKNLATRNFSLWKNINALLNKEGIREVGDTLEIRNKNTLDSIFKQTTPPNTPTPPTQKGLFDEVDSSVESQAEQKSLFDTQESHAQKVETSLSQEIKDTPKKSQREQVKQQLQSIKNIDITHKSGIVARLSSTGIDKMLSDKAIQKSLDNGFTKEQHFNAVADIERLFKNSDFSHTESPKNQSADIVGIHRYINTQDLQDQNAQALITLKESVENGNRIYSVELEGLAHPSNLDRSPKSKGVENSHHDDAGATESARLFENPSEIIPQATHQDYNTFNQSLKDAHDFFKANNKDPNIFHSNPHAGAGLLGGSVAGIETDENGNITFNPEKFALGFLGGAAGSKAVAKGLEWRANKVAKSYPNIAKNNPVLMEQIAKRDLLTYAKNESANALTRFLNKNKALDINTQLFAGEKALLNEAYAPHKARLAKAKELESKGADEIEIWEKTGWYKDKDKKWKFEISQRGGEFDFSGLEFYTFSRDNRVKLSRILKDDELFTAYPSLKNLIVNFDYGMNSYNLGSYAKDTKEITLNAKQLRDDKSRLSTLYHELQHAIQDIEGFGFGYKEAENLREISQESAERYAKQHGEVEARNVQKRLDNTYIGKIYSKQSLKDEIQKLKDVRLSLQKSDPDLAEVFDRRIKEYEKKYQNLGEHDIYNTRIHPHKTMDTPLSETIAEATIQGEALSKELESSFLDSSGRIDYRALMDKAEALPEQVRFTRFKEMIFTNPNARQIDSKNAVIQTPAGEVKVNVLRAFNHYFKQGKHGNKKENRQVFNATFMPTLLQPKFVTKDEAGTLYYYKPFVSKDKEYHITSIAVKRDGSLEYATSYNATDNRLKQMIKHNELVYFESGLS